MRRAHNTRSSRPAPATTTPTKTILMGSNMQAANPAATTRINTQKGNTTQTWSGGPFSQNIMLLLLCASSLTAHLRALYSVRQACKLTRLARLTHKERLASQREWTSARRPRAPTSPQPAPHIRPDVEQAQAEGRKLVGRYSVHKTTTTPADPERSPDCPKCSPRSNNSGWGQAQPSGPPMRQHPSLGPSPSLSVLARFAPLLRS